MQEEETKKEFVWFPNKKNPEKDLTLFSVFSKLAPMF
jgi:hypothetical protein